MKKLMVLLLTLTMFVFVVACSSSETTKDEDQKETNDQPDSTEQTDANEPEETERIVIKFAAQNDNTPATQAVIDQFNNQQDKYTVEWVQMTNDSSQMHDQLLTSLSSGSKDYDVMSLDVVWAGEFAGAGFIEPMDVMMREDGLNKTDFNSGSMASGSYQGKQYTLPFFPDLGLLYFRSDIVSEEDAAKLESGDYTYADLSAMAETYTGEEGTKYGFVYQSKQYEGLTVNVTEFTKSYEDVKGGLETMYALTNAPWAAKDILNFTEGETHTNFEQGNAVFARNWPYQFGRINGQEDGVTVSVDQVGIAPLPNGGSVGGWLLSINKNSDHIEGAWEFVSFVSGMEGQKIMSTQGGYLPGFNALLNDSEVVASNAMLSYDGFKKALETTIARPVSPEYSKVSDTIQVEAHKYLSSGEGLDEVVEEIESAVAE